MEAAFARLLPSLLKVIKANEGQVAMAALTTVGTLAAKYAPHFKATAAAILPAIIERSADTGETEHTAQRMHMHMHTHTHCR